MSVLQKKQKFACNLINTNIHFKLKETVSVGRISRER